MAKDFIDDDLSLYVAGGNKVYNKQVKLADKQEKIADQQKQVVDEIVRDKAKSVSNIKRVGELQGKPVTSQAMADAIKSLSNTVVGRINQLTLQSAKSFLPIDSQIKAVNDLLKSNKEDDQDRAFEMIDRLQSRLGIDLSKYSAEIGNAVEKLYSMNQQRKDDNEKAKVIHDNKITELTQEREILRERGINTIINEKDYKLELRTKQQEKIEKQQIIQKEKELSDRQRELQYELKQIQKSETIDTDKQLRIIAEYDNLAKDEKKLQERKEKAGIKPGERTEGFLSQTFGAALGEAKNFGKEIKQLGGDLFGTFKKVPDLFSSFGKGLTGGSKGLMGLAKGMIAPTLGFIIMGLKVAIIIAAIIAFIVAIDKAISWVKNLFKIDKEKEKIDQQSGQGKSQSVDETGNYGFETSTGETNEKIASSQQNNVNNQISNNNTTAGENKILPVGSDTTIIKSPEEKRAEMRARGQIPRGELNKMSSEFASVSQSKPSNTVVAPTSQIVTNNNTTQSVTMSPTNIDRSFINLNSVVV